MDLRFRHRQEAEKCGPQIPLTKYPTTSRTHSMEFSDHRVAGMVNSVSLYCLSAVRS